MAPWQLAVLVASAVLLGAATAEHRSLTFQVDPQKESCVYEEIQAGAPVEALVMVYRGGRLDIRLRIEPPREGPAGGPPSGGTPAPRPLYDQLLYSNIDDKTGAMLPTIVKKGHSFTASSAGVYGFCIDNRMARWTAKVVVFDLDVGRPIAAAIGAPGGSGAVGAPVVRGPTEDPDAHASQGLTDTVSDRDKTPAEQMAVMRSNVQRLHNKLMQVENDQMYHHYREQRHRATVDSTSGRVHWWSVVVSLIIISVSALEVLLVRRWFPDLELGGVGGGASSSYVAGLFSGWGSASKAPRYSGSGGHKSSPSMPMGSLSSRSGGTTTPRQPGFMGV